MTGQDTALDLEDVASDLAAMAATCSVDMALWDRFSNGVQRLIAELREARATYLSAVKGRADFRTAFRAQRDQALSEKAELVEALKPFAKFDLNGFTGVVLELVPSSPDNPAPRIEPILADYFRKARAALARAEAKP